MLVDFKECFINLVKDLIDVYDQTPTEDVNYPFGVIEITILPMHNLGHTINQVRCLFDIWSNNTNTREFDSLCEKLIERTNRISVFNFYGKIESVRMIATQEENLSRRQIIYDYKYIGGF